MITAAHAFVRPEEALSPHQVKVVRDKKRNAISFSRKRPAAGKFLRHQGIYGYTRELLLRFVKWDPSPLERAESLEQLRALENGVKIRVLVATAGSPGVDTPADAAALERVLARAARKNRRR